MAEHTFVSPLVEEFYNKCNDPKTGRFCSAGAKAKSSRAGASATKGHGSGKTEPGALSVTAKYGTRARGGDGKKKNYGSGKTDPEALKLTNRFGTRGGGKAKTSAGGTKTTSTKPAGKTVKTKSKYAADKFGSGKTEPKALSMTKRFGTRARGQKPKQYGSGKTEPEALKLTEKYGTRRRG